MRLMSRVIREYYKQTHTLQKLAEQKIIKFEKHLDIMQEFEQWILSKQYKIEGAVSVLGYTAKELAEFYPYLKGEGAFILLMELRDDPVKAQKRISSGFKRK